MPRRRHNPRTSPPDAAGKSPGAVRIIGGNFRGRTLRYHGDPRTRPMKDRVREAVFDLLGPVVRGKLAIDLFAGTGALGLEAMSRGARQAILIERHFPTIRLIKENIGILGIEDKVEVIAGSAFVWYRKRLPADDQPWLVFCSPPYDFYIERETEMRDLIQSLHQCAPQGSVIVVEADQRMDFASLPGCDASDDEPVDDEAVDGKAAERGAWSVREYLPAVIAIWR